MTVIVVMPSVVVASFSEPLRGRLADGDSGFSLGIVGLLHSIAVSSRERLADGDSWFPSDRWLAAFHLNSCEIAWLMGM